MKNGGGGTKIWSLDNWQSLRPITLWGSVKKSELINYKGWQWVQRDLVQTTFPSEWQGGTVPETWPVSVVLWPGSAPSHKLCEQGHSLDGKTGSHFSSHIIRVHIARICKLYLLAFCLSMSFAPITHFFCSNLLTRSSSIAYWLTLSRTVDLVHCTLSSARIRGSEKDSHCPNVRFASWLYLYRAHDCNYLKKCMRRKMGGGGLHWSI